MADFLQTIGAMIAAGFASIALLFSGGAHIATTHVPWPSTQKTQVASAGIAVKDPFHPVSNHPGTTTPHSASSDSTTSPQTTIVKQYITQPVVERIIQSPPMTSGHVLGASTDDTTAKLADLQEQINALSQLPQSVYVPSFSGPAASTPVNTATLAQGHRIDQLSGTSLSSITVNGVSGLASSDIPDLSGSYLSIASTSAARSTLGLSYATVDDIDNGSVIAAWGDSLTAGQGGTPYPLTLKNISGYYVYNGGVSEETSTEIKDRMIPHTAMYTWPTIIWVGRNNYSDPTTVKAEIASIVAALQSVGNDRYYVLSVLNGTSELKESSNYNTIITLNNDLVTIYGAHYIDIRSYLVSQYDFSQPQDVIDYGNDIPPASLRADGIHLNSAGYTLVANRLVQEFSETQTVATLASVRYLISTPGFQLGQNLTSASQSAFTNSEQLDATGWSPGS